VFPDKCTGRIADLTQWLSGLALVAVQASPSAIPERAADSGQANARPPDWKCSRRIATIL
jgi:hypothetical protein